MGRSVSLVCFTSSRRKLLPLPPLKHSFHFISLRKCKLLNARPHLPSARLWYDADVAERASWILGMRPQFVTSTIQGFMPASQPNTGIFRDKVDAAIDMQTGVGNVTFTSNNWHRGAQSIRIHIGPNEQTSVANTTFTVWSVARCPVCCN